MIRTVITPKSANIKISIPQEYVGKPIEVTFLFLEELEHNDSKKQWLIFGDPFLTKPPKCCTKK